MDKEELISVIVPAYRVEKYLPRCVDSILAQTYRNLEIILIDDGSPDNCGRICDQYQKLDNRVHVIHKRNEGLSVARNTGLNHIHGKYVTFIDSDDYVSSDYISYLYRLLTEYHADAATCFYQNVRSESQIRLHNTDRICVLSAREFISKMMYRDHVSHVVWGKLYRSELFTDDAQNWQEIEAFYEKDDEWRRFLPLINHKFRFPPHILNEDYALMYPMASSMKTIVCGEAEKYFFWIRPNSMTRSLLRSEDFSIFELTEIVEKYLKTQYSGLDCALCEIRGTVYVKLYKKILYEGIKRFQDEQKIIVEYLRKHCRTGSLRMPTKIRMVCGAANKYIFLLLSRIEDILGAKS